MRTTLITDPQKRPIYTDKRETDAHTALTRGLKEYIEDLDGTAAPDGRSIKFVNVFSTWPEGEDLGVLPAAIAYGNEAEGGEYAASKLSPNPDVVLREAQEGQLGLALISPAEFVELIRVEIWTTDPDERQSYTFVVESALTESEWMYGIRLALPHYFGAHADFELLRMGYDDSAVRAKQRYRISVFQVKASVPVFRLVELPALQPKSRLSINGLTGRPSVAVPP